MPMPEATVNEYDGIPSWKDEIGTARQGAGIESEAKTLCMEKTAEGSFRSSIDTANS
jgi:hypothetical protein